MKIAAADGEEEAGTTGGPGGPPASPAQPPHQPPEGEGDGGAASLPLPGFSSPPHCEAQRRVTIVGGPEAQWKAQYLIFEKLREEGFASGVDDVRLTVEIMVPSAQVQTFHHIPYTTPCTPHSVHHTPYTTYRRPHTYRLHNTPYTKHFTSHTVHHTPFTTSCRPLNNVFTSHRTPYTRY